MVIPMMNQEKHFLVTEHGRLPISHMEVLAAIHKRPLLNLEKLNTSQKHHTHCILHFSCLLVDFFVKKDYPLSIQIFQRRRKQGFRLDPPWFHLPDRALVPSYLFLVLNVGANSPVKKPTGSGWGVQFQGNSSVWLFCPELLEFVLCFSDRQLLF